MNPLLDYDPPPFADMDVEFAAPWSAQANGETDDEVRRRARRAASLASRRPVPPRAAGAIRPPHPGVSFKPSVSFARPPSRPGYLPLPGRWPAPLEPLTPERGRQTWNGSPEDGGSGSDATRGPDASADDAPSDHVRWVQSSLNQVLGTRLAIDGLLTPATRSATRTFQERSGIEMTGRIDPPTEAALRRQAPVSSVPANGFRDGAVESEFQGAIPPTQRRGNRGAPVRRVQQLLVDQGLPLQIDGIFGPLTEQAVKTYQQRRALVVDGIVGPQTWTALLGGVGTGAAGGGNGGTSGGTVGSCNPFQAEFERAAVTAGVPVQWATNAALCQLVRHESGWRPEVKNPNSSAFGLFQLLRGNWQKFLPEVPYGTVDPYWQAVGGFRYVKKGYRTPERAWAFWQATVHRNPALAPADLRHMAEDWISRNWGGYEL